MRSAYRDVIRLLLLPLFLLVHATAAPAFVCISTKPGGRCIHWASGNATLRTLLGSAGGTLINGTMTWDANAVSAAQEWTAVGAAFRYQIVFGGGLGDPCTPQGNGCPLANGDNPVFFSTSACGGNFGDIVAQTTNCFEQDSGNMISAPVFVNQNASFNAYDGALMPPINDMRRVLLHEFGHVLGLNHPDSAGQTVAAIMNSRESDLDRLQDDDRAGIMSIYPHNAPPSSGGCAVDAAPAAAAAWPLCFPVWLAVRRRAAGLRASAAHPTR